LLTIEARIFIKYESIVIIEARSQIREATNHIKGLRAE